MNLNSYYNSYGVSQSELKKYLKHPRQLFLASQKEEEDDLYAQEDSALTKGSIVDLLITNPDAQQIIDDNYIATENINLSETIKDIIRDLYRIYNPNNSNLENFRLEIWEICNDRQYYMNRMKVDPVQDKRVDDIIYNESAKAYLNYLISSKGKIIISKEMLEKAHVISTSIMTNSTYLKLIEDCEIWFQQPMFDDYSVMYANEFNTIRLKGLFDVFAVNHNKKEVTVIDFKVLIGMHERFIQSAYKFRYDIQGSFYSTLVSNNRNSLLLGAEKRDIVGYTINFYNVVGSFADPTHVEAYYYPDMVLYYAKVGKPSKNMLGWDQLLYRKLFYENNGLNYTPEYILNGGMNIMDMFKD